MQTISGLVHTEKLHSYFMVKGPNHLQEEIQKLLKSKRCFLTVNSKSYIQKKKTINPLATRLLTVLAYSVQNKNEIDP